jgi:probable addiction module antidote protein
MAKRDDEEVDLKPVMSRINAALASSDVVSACKAMGDAVMLHNVSEVARQSGLERSSLYRAFGEEHFPNLSTVLNVLDAMELHFIVVKRGKRPQRTVRRARSGSKERKAT